MLPSLPVMLASMGVDRTSVSPPASIRSVTDRGEAADDPDGVPSIRASMRSGGTILRHRDADLEA